MTKEEIISRLDLAGQTSITFTDEDGDDYIVGQYEIDYGYSKDYDKHLEPIAVLYLSNLFASNRSVYESTRYQCDIIRDLNKMEIDELTLTHYLHMQNAYDVFFWTELDDCFPEHLGIDPQDMEEAINDFIFEGEYSCYVEEIEGFVYENIAEKVQELVQSAQLYDIYISDVISTITDPDNIELIAKYAHRHDNSERLLSSISDDVLVKSYQGIDETDIVEFYSLPNPHDEYHEDIVKAFIKKLALAVKLHWEMPQQQDQENELQRMKI